MFKQHPVPVSLVPAVLKPPHVRRPLSIRCSSTTSQSELESDTLVKKKSPNSIACLSSVIQVLKCLRTIAECSQIPGLYCLFHTLVQIFDIVKDTKENIQNAKYLLRLSEEHLNIALESSCPKNGIPSFTPPKFVEYVVETLLEISNSTTLMKKRGPIARLRHALSDKEELKNLTKKLDDGVHLFLVEKKRLGLQTRIEEMSVLLDKLLKNSEEINAKLDQISARLDKIEQRSDQDFYNGLEAEANQRTINSEETTPVQSTNIQPLIVFARHPPPATLDDIALKILVAH